MMRPVSLALWLVIFAFEAQTVISTGGRGNLLGILLSTALFAGIHAQFWTSSPNVDAASTAPSIACAAESTKMR